MKPKDDGSKKATFWTTVGLLGVLVAVVVLVILLGTHINFSVSQKTCDGIVKNVAGTEIILDSGEKISVPVETEVLVIQPTQFKQNYILLWHDKRYGWAIKENIYYMC